MLVASLLIGACSAGSTVPTADTALTTTTTALPTTTAIVSPGGGLLAFGAFGVRFTPKGGGDDVTLTTDPFYEAVEYLVPDRDGGIVYVHRVTPMAWLPGSVLWLPGGDAEPRLVVAGSSRTQLIPRGIIEVAGARFLLYIEWDMDTRQGSAKLKPLLAGAPVTVWAAAAESVQDATTGGGRILLQLVEGFPSDRCRLVLVDAYGLEVDAPGLPDCAEPGDPRSFQLSSDGTEVWYIDGRGERLVVQGLDDPAEVMELPIARPHGVRYDGNDTAVVSTDTGPLLITRSHGALAAEPIAVVEGAAGLLPYTGTIALTADARLGTGLAEYPCTTRLPALPEQDLPPAVAATRRSIYEAIANCDWVALRELATAQGGIHYAVAYEPGLPVPYWIELMRSGNDILGDIATVLTLPAIEVDHGDGAVSWVWPAVAGKEEEARTDADWQALLPLYTQEEIDAIRYGPEGYAGGFELIISLDGTWVGAFILSV